MDTIAVIPDLYLVPALRALLRIDDPTAPPWELVLWCNDDLVPNGGTVLGDLQEPTWSGYTRRTIQRDEWGTPTVLDGCARSEPAGAPYEWVHGGGATVTVRGWALWQAVGPLLPLVVRLPDADHLEVSAGATYRLSPAWTLTSGACPMV